MTRRGALALWPHVLTVEHTSGNRDLTLLVAVADMAALSRFLLESLGTVPGVLATRAHLVTQVFTQGDQWQQRVLDATQRTRLTEGHPHPARTAPSGRALDAADRRLILCLGQDGRASLSDLARDTGLSVSTVRRRLDDLLAREELLLRCDVALPLSGWPIAMYVWGRTDPDDHETVTALVRRIPGTRVCLRLSGSAPNLLLGIAMHSLHEVPAMESRLAREAPRLTVLDRSMVLRFIKRMGRVLDSAGRSIRTVPMDIWSDPRDVPAARPDEPRLPTTQSLTAE